MNERFSFFITPLKGLWVVKRNAIKDERGSFCRLFSADEFKKVGINKPLIQINRSINRRKGTVRGFHYQDQPYTETKVVMCVKGEIFDIAVDIRKGSDTFLQWHGEILSQDNEKALVIPEGFAHGFQTLADDCEIIYLHTQDYVPHSERGINILDPKIHVSWPLPVRYRSERDKNLPITDEIFLGVPV